MHRFLSLFLFLFVLAGMGPAAGQSSLSSTPPDSSTVPTPTTSEPESGDERTGWMEGNAPVVEHADDYVGAYDGHEAPYGQESAVYRAPPPVRYNRVEGLVVGLQREPLSAGADEETRLFGQLGYATALRDVRYTAGLESRLYASKKTSLTLGLAYQEQTLSPDAWKTSYLENSLASAGFRHDFFDYYEAEGLTVYGRQALPGSFQFTTGLRVEEHRRLPVATNWSVFGDGRFRTNPTVDEGRMRALFAELTGGQIHDREGLPSGQAVRLAATTADGIGGDFDFSRYEADARFFLPLTPDTRLGLRLRGGYATHRAPRQMQFTIGGIGSARSYAQNAVRGPRLLLANAEYLIDGATVIDGLFDDLFLAGLLDAGWTGGPTDRPRADEVLPSAGFGIGLDGRQARLDVTWPLRDGPGTSSRPSVWLRVAPSF